MPFRAKFWQQLRATLIRNVLRKKRNKRHMMKVNTEWRINYCCKIINFLFLGSFWSNLYDVSRDISQVRNDIQSEQRLGDF